MYDLTIRGVLHSGFFMGPAVDLWAAAVASHTCAWYLYASVFSLTVRDTYQLVFPERTLAVAGIFRWVAVRIFFSCCIKLTCIFNV